MKNIKIVFDKGSSLLDIKKAFEYKRLLSLVKVNTLDRELEYKAGDLLRNYRRNISFPSKKLLTFVRNKETITVPIEDYKQAKYYIDKHKKIEKQERENRKKLEPEGKERNISGTMQNINYVAGVRLESGYFMHVKKRLSAVECFVYKTPKDNDKHVGIELEFCSKVNASTLALLFAELKLESKVCIKGDGSLRAKAGDYALELNILLKERELESALTDICAVLNSEKVGAYVNETCGMHVHIDMRNRDAASSYRKLFKAQKFLIETQPPCRKTSTFCKTNEYSDFNQAKRTDGRYWVINTQAHSQHSTLEVRSHSGTINYTKIVNWCKLLVAIVDGEDTPAAKGYHMFSTLKKRTNLSDDIIAHFKARLEKFKVYYSDNENTDMSVVRLGTGREDRYFLNESDLTIEKANTINSDNAERITWDNDIGSTQIL